MLPTTMYPMRYKPSNEVVHQIYPNSLFHLPMLVQGEMMKHMEMAAKLYSSKIRVEFDDGGATTFQYIHAVTKLIVAINHLNFYLGLKNVSVQEDLFNAGYRPDYSMRLNDLISKVRFPKPVTSVILFLSSPLQVSENENYIFGPYSPEEVMNQVNELIPEVYDLLPISAVFDGIYDILTIPLTVARDTRKLQLFEAPILRKFIAIMGQETENYDLLYPTQFIDWANVGYPVQWYNYQVVTAFTEELGLVMSDGPDLVNADYPLSLYQRSGLTKLHMDTTLVNINLVNMVEEFLIINKEIKYANTVTYPRRKKGKSDTQTENLAQKQNKL